MNESKQTLEINEGFLSLRAAREFVFYRESFSSVSISDGTKKKVQGSHAAFLKLLDSGIPIYGVTTGFGDSCFRVISSDQSEKLQANLVSYLLCGTGETLPYKASRAIVLFRLLSLSRGFSGVSSELIERMKLFLEHDWLPIIPREGSLGASGDLIPLAYLAQVLQGEGTVRTSAGVRDTRQVLEEHHLTSYRLKPKEGLALVNGTSAMAGLSLLNLNTARFLIQSACISSSWLCMALKGRVEAYDNLVNERAKAHPGQKQISRWIRKLLEEESYSPKPLSEMKITNGHTENLIQDRYSLRCAPQILGPVLETLQQSETWLEYEINGTSDNPLIDVEGRIAMGGNFYGGYLAHSMDYLKICVGHIADMMDRQLMSLVDEKSNRGLPPNLANWAAMPEDKRHLHHGLKGLHQSVSALTSEILSRAVPNSIFSRSSESHNQDKVSLGMSAAVQCSEMLETLVTVQSLYFICLAQALDLRGIQLKGKTSRMIYEAIRQQCPFVASDKALEQNIRGLRTVLIEWAEKKGDLLKFDDEVREGTR